MNTTMAEGSPWSSLLRDNLDADEVAGFLSNAIARKEASLLSNTSFSEVTAAPPPTDQTRRESGVSMPPFSAERARDHQARERARDRETRERARDQLRTHAPPPLSASRGRPSAAMIAEALYPSLSPRARSPERIDDVLAEAPGSYPWSPQHAHAEAIAAAGGGALSAPRTLAQWQGYVLKAQQSEASAREETRQMQSQMDRVSARHVDELAEAHRAREEMRGQLEVRQFALQHATDARDAATRRAEGLERELSALRQAHEETVRAAAEERERLSAAAREAEAATMAALEQARAHDERAGMMEIRAVGAERTCVTLRLAVTSLEHAKGQVVEALEGAHAEVEAERRRTAIERALLRSYANETEQRVPIVSSMAEAAARETERVEAALTTQLTASEAASGRAAAHYERTVAQLRGHIAELEEAVIDQQASHEQEEAERHAAAEAAHAEVSGRALAAEGRCDLLSQQVNALAEAAQQIKAERSSAMVGLAGAAARLTEVDAELGEARSLVAAAEESEAVHTGDVAELRASLRGLGEQLNWLEACSRDAASDARPLLASRDASPVHDADAAFRDERARWSAGVSELRETVDQIVGAFGWLVAELQQQLVTSPAAGLAATPAADLHEDLAGQIRAAVSGLPSTFAPSAAFARARSTLVEALTAQAQLATQSVTHLISCAADAEAMATLRGKQLRAQHEADTSAWDSERLVAIDVVAAELMDVEHDAACSSTLAWRHAGGLAVLRNELHESETQLVREATERAAVEQSLEAASAALAAARHTDAQQLAELREMRAQLGAGADREALLEQTLRSNGLEGKLCNEELLAAVRQAEESGAERAAAAAAAIADASVARDERGLESFVLRAELARLEAELEAGATRAVHAARALEARESARAAAHAAGEAAAEHAAALEASLAGATAALATTRLEAASAAASAQRHAVESVEWAAKAQALEAVGAADKRHAAGKHAALVSGLGELDDSVHRASAALSVRPHTRSKREHPHAAHPHAALLTPTLRCSPPRCVARPHAALLAPMLRCSPPCCVAHPPTACCFADVPPRCHGAHMAGVASGDACDRPRAAGRGDRPRRCRRGPTPVDERAHTPCRGRARRA